MRVRFAFRGKHQFFDRKIRIAFREAREDAAARRLLPLSARVRAILARFIEARYFVAQNEGRALLRNGIARLWWVAHLSHDATRNNPYELTAALLYTLDITQQILEWNCKSA